MNKDIYADRKPVLTAWVVMDDPDPDQWTVNISASILQAHMMIRAMGEGSIQFAQTNRGTAAKVAYFLAEDLTFQLNKIGGSEAAARISREINEGDDHR